MGVQTTLSGFNPTMGVPPGGMKPFDEDTNPYGLQRPPPSPMPWGDYGGYDTPEKRGIANLYGPDVAWGNARRAVPYRSDTPMPPMPPWGQPQPQVMPPEFNMPGAPATQQFANTAYQTPWNTGGIGGLASGPNSFIPTPTGGAQPMLDLLARQRETYLPMLTGAPEDRTPPVTPPPPPPDPPVTDPTDPTDPNDPTYPGDDTIEEYINNWLTDNPNYLDDYINSQIGGGIGGIDPSQFMTNQDFTDWLTNYQPNIDMSSYMTNQGFNDYMGGYDPNIDMSSYMTNQGFQDWLNNYQPQTTDMSNYMTNQGFEDYMGTYNPNIDMSNYMTNQAFDDYMSNYQPDLDMSQYVTQGGLNTALQGLGSLNTNNPSVADYSYNVNPFTR
jgi:hypothetical protein